MRDGRLGSCGGAGTAAAMAAAWALALIAGCASPRPPRPVFTPRSCPERPALVNRDLLPECVWEPSREPPSCVPVGHRGREIARDEENRLRAYEMCVPESRYATTNRLRVDPGRVIVERTGEHPAGEEDLLAISLRLRNPSPSRAPEPPNGRPPPPPAGPQLSVPPVEGTCWIDDRNSDRCLEMHLQGPPPEAAALLAAIAKWLPRGDACIAMQVDFGWEEGCPEGPGPMVPQSR